VGSIESTSVATLAGLGFPAVRAPGSVFAGARVFDRGAAEFTTISWSLARYVWPPTMTRIWLSVKCPACDVAISKRNLTWNTDRPFTVVYCWSRELPSTSRSGGT